MPDEAEKEREDGDLGGRGGNVVVVVREDEEGAHPRAADAVHEAADRRVDAVETLVEHGEDRVDGEKEGGGDKKLQIHFVRPRE